MCSGSLVDCQPCLEPTIGPLGLGNFSARVSQDKQAMKRDKGFWDIACNISLAICKGDGNIETLLRGPYNEHALQEGKIHCCCLENFGGLVITNPFK